MTADVRDYLIDTVKVKRDDAAFLVNLYTESKVSPVDSGTKTLDRAERLLAFYIKCLQQLADCQ